MALAFAVKASVASGTDATTYTTSAFTPAASAGIVVAVFNSKGSAPDLASLDSPTWLDGSWTQEADEPHSSTNMRLTVFSGKTIGSPGSDDLTASFGGVTQLGCRIIVIEVTGQDPTDFVLQPISSEAGAGTTNTITLGSALVAATSQVLAFRGINSNVALAPGDGETELDDVGHAAPTRALQAQHKLNDTSSVVTYTSSTVVAVALEIVEATGGAVDADAEVSWAEFEVPTADSSAQVAWAEVELPTANAEANVVWAEFEVPFVNSQAELSWAELQVPELGDPEATPGGRRNRTGRHSRTASSGAAQQLIITKRRESGRK